MSFESETKLKVFHRSQGQ